MSCEQMGTVWVITVILLVVSVVVNIILAHDSGIYEGRLEQYEPEVEVTEAK